MTWFAATKSALRDLEQPVLWILCLFGAICSAMDIIREVM